LNFKRVGSALLFSVLFSCSSGPYHYAPDVSPQNNDVTYNVPESNPKGTLQVRYLGIESKPGIAGQITAKSIHFLLLAENHAASGTWTLDSKDLFVVFPEGPQTHPSYASPEQIKIEAGGRKGMDVLIPFPANVTLSDVPKFEVHWQIKADQETYAQVTPFKRMSGREDKEAETGIPSYNVSEGLLFGGEYGWL
jgi:hypothetical protein